MNRAFQRLLLLLCLALPGALTYAAEATVKISELSAASAPDGSELVECVQTTNKKCTVTQIRGTDNALDTLADGTGLSVVGVTGNSTTTYADITAGTDKHILRRSGTSVGFGTIDYAAAGGSTLVPLANGGLAYALTDPNADRISFWDDSAGHYEWLTIGTGLSITGTTLDVTGGGGGSGTVNTGVAGGLACYPGAGTTIDDFTGGAGTAGQVLVSLGVGLCPEWSDGISVSSLTTATDIQGADLLLNGYSNTDSAPRKMTVAAMKNRLTSITTATSFTPNADKSDIVKFVSTEAAGTLTVNAPTGTPIDGQLLTIRIKATNVQTFSWNAIYDSGTAVLPTATAGSSATEYYGFIYNDADSKWQYLSFAGGF
jgi:hypothetical protein